jgi:hypothetical protein
MKLKNSGHSPGFCYLQVKKYSPAFCFGPRVSSSCRVNAAFGWIRRSNSTIYTLNSAMKFTLASPRVRLPEIPSFYISNKIPKVRMPLLSLFVEPRSLAKWCFMWGFCAYLVVCMGFYFVWEQPRLDHESYVRFGADSPTYWDAAKYRTQHADNAKSLVSFEANLLGPVAIALLLQNGLIVAAFNIFLFFFAVEIACSIPGVDRYLLLFLLAINAETSPALVTLNKEIFVLFSALLLAKYITAKRRSWVLLILVLAASLLARWEQIGFILMFLFLQRRGSYLQRHPRVALASVIGLFSVVYPLIALIPHSGLRAFTQYLKGANTIAKLNVIQTHFGFPLVVIPKIIMDVMGELLRPKTYLAEFDTQGYGDIHSRFIIPLFSIALMTLLVAAYRRGKLNPARPVGMLILIGLIVTAVTPFVQPRYNYFSYVLLCLEIARKEVAPEEQEPKGLSPALAAP